MTKCLLRSALNASTADKFAPNRIHYHIPIKSPVFIELQQITWLYGTASGIVEDFLGLLH